jgi:adenine deaminase
VAGVTGIQYLLNASEYAPLDIFVMLPSCVPATPFESNGARLKAEQLSTFTKDPRVLGLAEVMDFPSVASGEKGMMEKLAMTLSNGGRIDGHAAGLSREELNIYMAAGIRTDHESVTVEEAQDRLDLGMYLMIREGTVAKNLDALLPVITEKNARRCLFVTDDKLIDDLIEEGSVDHIVRRAIQRGLDPILALQMVTLNAAECFGLSHLGAVAPGYQADFLLLDDLADFSIHQVYKKGKCLVDKGQLNDEEFPLAAREQGKNRDLPKLRVKEVTAEDLNIPLIGTACHVIEIIPNSLITRHSIEEVDVINKAFSPSIKKDQLKLAVIERHRATGNVGVGIVKGFQLKKGAIASTVSHDSHNIVVVGTTDEEMLAAVENVIQMQGGLVIVEGQEVLASLSLPVAGLLSDQSYDTVYESLKKLNEAQIKIGAPHTFNPFLTLSFLTLTVIPELKLTDKGLFDFASFSHLDVAVK